MRQIRPFIMTLMLGIVSPLAFAYPDKPIRIVVPYTAGGGTDITARLFGNELATAFKQTVIVENKPGGNTIIGMQAIARAEPDGYTIGLVTDAHSINQAIRKAMPFDPVKDFAGVSMLVTSPFVLVANPSLKVRSVADLVAKAKREPGTISYASAGEKRIGRINALFTQVQQLWTAVDSFDTPAMQPNPADGEPATLKIYPPLSH